MFPIHASSSLVEEMSAAFALALRLAALWAFAFLAALAAFLAAAFLADLFLAFLSSLLSPLHNSSMFDFYT